MRDEKEERKKQDQTNKAKQHSTPKAGTFPRKNELPTTLYTLDRALYQLSYRIYVDTDACPLECHIALTRMY